MRPILLLPWLALPALVAPAHAQSQIHRCTGPDGTPVFTDRRCEDLGALARLPPPERRDGEAGLYRHGCPRRLSELVYQLRAAIDARDVNRLSSLYLWTDLSEQAANQVLTRLEAIAARPLADIAPVYPETAEAVAPAGTPPAHPTGLRLEQTLSDGRTPSRTIFGLRRQYGCFWIGF